MAKSKYPGIKTGRVGRRSIYTREFLDVIYDRIASGEAARWIFANPAMPDRSMFQRWLARAHLTDKMRRALIAAGECQPVDVPARRALSQPCSYFLNRPFSHQ